MAIQLFENIDYTRIQVFNTAAAADIELSFFFDEFDLITQRKLVGYSYTASYLAPFPAPIRRIPLDWVVADLTISQPLPQTKVPTLNSTLPIGGSQTVIPNVITLQGNGGVVSLIPLDVTKFRVVLRMSHSDGNMVNNAITAELNLFWDQPKVSGQ